MFIEAVMTWACMIPNLILLKSKPLKPPSFSAGLKRTGSIHELFKNRNYLILWLVYGIFFGSFNALGIVISYLVKLFFK
jgi:hypothetical protein